MMDQDLKEHGFGLHLAEVNEVMEEVVSIQDQILMIEDDAALRTALDTRLRGEGYSVVMTTSGREGFKMASSHAFDLILLDIMLPDSDGLNICSDIRRAGIETPIVVLTARTQLTDKLLGFRLGADAYVTKPFDTAELLARIEALLRRVRVRSVESIDQAGAIKIDSRRTQVTRDGKPVDMAAREFRLLHYLLKRSGTCVSREELLKAVWGYASSSATRTIDMHIANLRQKLEVNPKLPRLILTIPGVGYKFVRSSSTWHKR